MRGCGLGQPFEVGWDGILSGAGAHHFQAYLVYRDGTKLGECVMSLSLIVQLMVKVEHRVTYESKGSKAPGVTKAYAECEEGKVCSANSLGLVSSS